ILLEDAGCTCDVVANGEEALAALRTQVYDVVFMDVQMPVMDGIEATRCIRREWPFGRRPRIIALTAGVMSDEVEMCRQAGMEEFLAKPIDPEKLAGALSRCHRIP